MTNATPTFSIKESLIFGWEAFLLHYRIFIPAMFLTLVISFLPEFIGKDYSNGITVIALVLGMIVQIIVGMGITKLALKITAGEQVMFDDIFSTTHLFFPYVGAHIVYGCIVLAGLLLFIIPGILWSVSYWLFSYVLLDKELGAWEALSEAKRISKGARWELFKFMVVVGVLNLAGILIFFVGLFITIPITTVATAYVYRQLLNKQQVIV
ncbi:MAG: hypothetical protein A3J54_03165 [Candidatus Ryanbacteria bacterium RIFCSPHIGHO2_02_FULL_45_13b]|uniref:Glycerophosphoryl diester phosphodiesterase membrane domain-containing protein n=1 Tax=Candidatus Ryanbacteria bacterium RIFCSPHIGHO2_02_FULL_45_13b TaxID=1802117 RepID=A0A1G2G491_9BACT|nr:MAG: hypothetical protein A3J54_03165 [Candidatus Ryanbacteria bacterium RIFCSPHIGHO2_02_FULL_45_13b]